MGKTTILINTSSVSSELLHWLACSQFLSKLACQITFIFIESKVIICQNATGARSRANLCNNSGETEEVHVFGNILISYERKLGQNGQYSRLSNIASGFNLSKTPVNFQELVVHCLELSMFKSIRRPNRLNNSTKEFLRRETISHVQSWYHSRMRLRLCV